MVSTKEHKKFDFRIILFVAIAIFIAAIAVLFSGYSQKTGQLEEVNKKLSSVQGRVNTVNLAPLNNKKVELELQANQTAVNLTVARVNLSQSVNRTTAIGVLFAVARAHALEVTKMTFEGPVDALLGEMPVSSATLTATVEGDIPGLAAFITELNTFKNGAVDSAVITSETVNATGNTTGSVRSWADIRITLYTVQGR